ncbi:MAG: ABC transporter permease [Candidatus Thorarchaeota archaeon]
MQSERTILTPLHTRERYPSIWLRFEKFISGPVFQRMGLVIVLAFFFLIVLAPILYLFSFIIIKWEEVFSWVFDDPIIEDRIWYLSQKVVIRSFQIAFIVTIIDVLLGVPLALILARYEFRGKNILDTLVDIPMAVPTSALGFSIFLFWGTSEGIGGLLGLEKGLLSLGPQMIIAAHVAFSFPYIVRNLRAVLADVSFELEYSARTLGASSTTTYRTVTAPLTKEALVAGAILAFTRSLGETGATLIVFGTHETAPVAVVSFVKTLRIAAAAFLALLLVIFAIFLLIALRIFSRRVGLPIQTVWVGPEQFLSSKGPRRTRTALSILLFGFLVLIPSLFVLEYLVLWLNGSPYTGDREAGALYQVFEAPDNKWDALFHSLLTSLQIATIVAAINLVMGIPMALILTRRQWGIINEILDAVVDLPLVIPSSALGFAVLLTYGQPGIGLLTPGFWMIVVVHVTMTYPFCVRPLIAVLQGTDPEFEEAAQTLGAPPATVLRTVTFPLLKQGMLAAFVMTFTRSLSETGATIVVMGVEKTIPVLIVDWVESGFALPAAAFACAVLIIPSFLLLLIMRQVTSNSRSKSSR